LGVFVSFPVKLLEDHGIFLKFEARSVVKHDARLPPWICTNGPTNETFHEGLNPPPHNGPEPLS
jgi:hypothetical protein